MSLEQILYPSAHFKEKLVLLALWFGFRNLFEIDQIQEITNLAILLKFPVGYQILTKKFKLTYSVCEMMVVDQILK